MAKWKEPFRLEAGKCYIDVFGNQIGPLRRCGDGFDVEDTGPQCELLYEPDGEGLGNPDLVAEWVDDDTGCPNCGSGEDFHHPNCAMGSPASEPVEERSVFDDPPPYANLQRVLLLALEQASGGKGAQRHGQGKPFDRQPMLEISRMLNGSPIGCMYQAIKKTQEASRMDVDAAQRELLGAINYLAGAYLLLEESSAT